MNSLHPETVASRRHLSKFGLRRLASDERGMSTVEYVILLAVIVVGAITLWQDIGTHVTESLRNAEGELDKL